MDALGWEQADVILFMGDAYVDHPSFGVAVIARVLEDKGYKVAVVPQPNWRDDLRDFRKLGRPRLFFGVGAGAMDSMVNHYTAGKRLRHDDAYTPDGKAGARPDYAVSVYSRILKELYPDVPVVIGGVEASLRRLTHYDYWKDQLLPSILEWCPADYLCYGMGETTMLELTRAIEDRRSPHQIRQIPQIAFRLSGRPKASPGTLVLSSYEECLKDKSLVAKNFHIIETNANMLHASVIVEPVGDGYVQVNPPEPPSTTEEMDSFWDLPFTKLPHPRYRGKRIPAYDMIKDSIITHRGCFGGCNFCTIAAHQGKFIQSRSKESIVAEVRRLAAMPEFSGNISDLGAPTANMYMMKGKDPSKCAVCRRKSCLFPSACVNMDRSHAKLLDLYKAVDAVPGVRHSYIGSGIRYDLFLSEDGFVDSTSKPYLRTLILDHTSGRLKVAPEHTEDRVLQYLGKPSFRLFERLRFEFDKICRENGRRTGIVPYFISSHPGCTMRDMENLSKHPALKGIFMDQVQDFTPTPMTTSSVMFYTGLDPRTMRPVFVERDPERKRRQKSFFFRKK